MSISIELAKLGAAQLYRDATAPNIYGFERFFKNTKYPVITMLEDIEQWRPLGILMLRFACVKGDFLAYFSDMFIRPATWILKGETVTPDHSDCPDIQAN